MNTIASLIGEIKTILIEQIVQDIRVLNWRRNVFKVRLYLAGDIFIQVYRNDRNNNTSFALICEETRLYARDEIAGNWHRHPFGEPEYHDNSADGKTEVSLTTFYQEVLDILIRENII